MSLEDKTKNIEVTESEQEQAYAKMESLKPYFYKGARNMLAGIYQAVSLIAENPDDEPLAEDVKNMYNDFEKNYPEVNADDVKKTPELKPLYEMKSLRKELKPILADFFDNPTLKKGKAVEKKIREILNLGEEYTSSFKDTLNQIRKFNPDYTVEIADKRTGTKRKY